MKKKSESLILTPETQQLLDYIRRQRKESRVFGIPADEAKQRAHEQMDHILDCCGLKRLRLCELKWFVSGVAAALASTRGEFLAIALEGQLNQAWVTGLEPNTIQLIARELCDQLGGIVPEEQPKAEVRMQSAEGRSEEGRREESQEPKGRSQKAKPAEMGDGREAGEPAGQASRPAA